MNPDNSMTRDEFIELTWPLFKSACAAEINGTRVTVSFYPDAHGKIAKPIGFPRGELLSENQDGVRNYAYDPEKILSWIRKTSLELAK